MKVAYIENDREPANRIKKLPYTAETEDEYIDEMEIEQLVDVVSISDYTVWKRIESDDYDEDEIYLIRSDGIALFLGWIPKGSVPTRKRVLSEIDRFNKNIRKKVTNLKKTIEKATDELSRLEKYIID